MPFHISDPGATATLRNGFQFTLLTRGKDIRRNQPAAVQIRDVLNNQPNSAQFTIDGTSNVPVIGEKIEIRDEVDNNRLLFAGTVQTVTQIYEGQTDQLAFQVTCIDFTWLFNRKRPFGTYYNISASEVVTDLVIRYAPGFTVNHVQTNLAKVNVVLDGSLDLATVFNNIAAAIGGGHWKIDYTQDVHFFHVVPTNLTLPPSEFQAPTSALTIAQGNPLAAPANAYVQGYYFLRYTFVYNDGTESQFQSISNVLLLDGQHQLVVTNLPIGTPRGTLTVTKRRVYYNAFLPTTIGGGPNGGQTLIGDTPIETIKGYCEVADNTTTGFTSDFGAANANTAAVVPIGAPSSTKTFTAHGALSPAPPAGYVQLSDQAADLNLTGSVSNGFYAGDPGILTDYTLVGGVRFSSRGWAGYNGACSIYQEGSNPNPRAAGDVYYATQDVATVLENSTTVALTAVPTVQFNGHPNPPDGGLLQATPDLVTNTANFFNGGIFQFKVALLYRDGSVSFPSTASPSAGVRNNVNGTGIIGWSLTGIPVGPTINGNDVVARIVYYAMGLLQDPNFSVSGPAPLAIGYVWPIPSLDPDWASAVGGIVVIPDNTTTQLLHFSLSNLGTNLGLWNALYTDPGVLVGGGNKPYNNGSILSSDPIPIWPNPDGPSLEDVDPPGDLTDANPDLLHQDTGGQDFQVMTDLSQVRNRVFVVGSGSTATATAAAGSNTILVADIASFSPAGGTVKIEDPATGLHQIVKYNGVTGVVGATAITLSAGLVNDVAQGSVVNNFFQADDFDSQKALAKAELDANGLPTDGIHEYTIVDGTLKAQWQLFMRAYAELELFSKPIVTIKYSTRDPKSKSGQTVHADMTNPPCQGDFLIQEVDIDQFRDEGDQVAPRYTVTASSVKFDLSDLLLQIIGGAVGGAGSVSFAGVAAAGTTQAVSTTATGIIDILRGGFSYSFINATNGTLVTVGSPSASISGTASIVNDARGMWQRSVSAATTGQKCGYAQSATFLRAENDPVICFYTRTGPLLSNIRLWMGFAGSGVSFSNVDKPVQQSFGLRWSTSAGDPGPTLFVTDGSVNGFTLGPSFPPLIPNTEYEIRIAVSGVVNLQVRITPAGGSAQTLTMALPGYLFGIDLFIECSIFTNENVAKRLDFLRIGLQHGLLL